MKNVTSIFCFLYFSCSLMAQDKISLISPEMETLFFQKDSIPAVKGQLLNDAANELRYLTIEYELLSPIGGTSVVKKAAIHSDGTFLLQLNYPIPYQQINLSVGEIFKGEIIVEKGLTIELDIAQLKLNPVRFLGRGVQFGGPDAALNVYVNRFNDFKNREKREFYIARQNLVMNSQLTTAVQLEQYEIVYQIWDSLLGQYFTEFPSEYEWVLKNERLSDYYGYLFTLFWQKQIPPYLLNQALTHQPFLLSKASATYYKYLARLMKLISPERNYEVTKNVLESRVFGDKNLEGMNKFLVQYKNRLTQQPFEELIFQNGIQRFLTPNREVLRKAKLDEFAINLTALTPPLADVLKLFAAPSNRYQRKSYFKKLLPQTGTNWVSTFMIDEVGVIENYVTSVPQTLPVANTITTNAALGTPLKNMPFGAALYLGEAPSAANFVATLQNAFPDKAIILDVWATWCRPCIVDMQKSQATKNTLKELPVEIIYLAVEEGSSQLKWEQSISKLAVSGNHIYIQKELANSLLKYFNLFGYPSYIFIDKNGNWDANLVRSIANLDMDKLKARL